MHATETTADLDRCPVTDLLEAAERRLHPSARGRGGRGRDQAWELVETALLWLKKDEADGFPPV